MSLEDELSKKVSTIFSDSWNVRNGRVVPSTDDIGLGGEAVKLEATFLYADLAQSSHLTTDFHKRTAARVIRAFLYCMSRIISINGGVITSFDGDRVMGVFIGNSKNSNATKCALKINYVVTKIIQPKVQAHFNSLRDAGFNISHCVGVDTGNILAVRAGQIGSSDIVWIGRAPNLAAKLSEIREGSYHSFISDDVFSRLSDSSKYGGDPLKLMWEERKYNFIGNEITVHRSNWTWSL